MFHLVYLSTAIARFEPRLLELLEDARVKNDRTGIIGMLLYKRGSIIQVLEGDEANVRELFESLLPVEETQAVTAPRSSLRPLFSRK